LLKHRSGAKTRASTGQSNCWLFCVFASLIITQKNHQFACRLAKRYVYKDIMRKLAIIFSIILSPVILAQDLYLSNEAELQVALAMNKALKVVSKSVTACIQSGKEHSVCLCNNRNEITNFNRIVKSAFHKYPYWLKVRTLNFSVADFPNVVINPSALLAEANKKLDCD